MYKVCEFDFLWKVGCALQLLWFPPIIITEIVEITPKIIVPVIMITILFFHLLTFWEEHVDTIFI
jgi:hypothetical protein